LTAENYSSEKSSLVSSLELKFLVTSPSVFSAYLANSSSDISGIPASLAALSSFSSVAEPLSGISSVCSFESPSSPSSPPLDFLAGGAFFLSARLLPRLYSLSSIVLASK